MKIRGIINYIKNTDPCGVESTCLVRPACYMLHKSPWKRSLDCPDYKKYLVRKDFVSGIVSEAIEWFWICFMLVAFITICFIFFLGAMKFIEIIQNLFR